MRIVFWLLLFLSNCLYSQAIIKGQISDTRGKVIVSASVSIYKKSSSTIIAYAITDSKGLFAITFVSPDPEVDLEVRCMGYETVLSAINNTTQTKNFILSEKSFVLKEVSVKAAPILQKGDTLRYMVNSFSKEQDRSIGDVLKRMPGIEVLPDGKILYQGKAINKYYIEGLDLLEGKYNLANDNLPYQEVSQVQILENHQPIKTLDSLQFSDRTALNIKLKNSYTFTGQARIGTGFSPLLWDANITPMLFSKKRQMLTTYQTNNTGDNVASQLKKLTIEDLLNQFENNSEKIDWLAVQQLANPKFSEKRWLDNSIHLLSSNYLQKLQKDYELRVNVSYLNDYQQQKGFTNTQFFTPSGTIDLLEEKYNQFYYNSLQTNFTIQKNTTKNYFKNSLEFQGFWDSQRGNIVLNNKGLKQELSNEYFRFSNNLKSIFSVGKQKLVLFSYLGFNKTPQELRVHPGQFEGLLNENKPYDSVTQHTDLLTYYTNNTLSMIKAVKYFTLESKVGLQLENQKLNSDIATSTNSNLIPDFSNTLDWFRSKVYVDLQTQFKKANWRIELLTPINLHSYTIRDAPLQQSENVNQTTFEPRLTVNYDINFYWKINSSAGISNQFGTINQLHYGYILQNYRSIKRIISPLPQSKIQNYNVGISFRNPVKSLFFNTSYSNVQSENNLLYQSEVLANGAVSIEAIEQLNTRYSHNFSTRIGKYISTIKSNVTLNSSFALQEFQQIINANLVDIANQNLVFGSKIDTDLTDWLNLEYAGSWMFSNNKIEEQKQPQVKQQNHVLNLNFNLKSKQYIGLKSEYVNTTLFHERNENVFADFIYRYTIQKKKIDFEMQLNNVFGTNNFKTINVNDFSYVTTNFMLRPRQLLFKVRFSL
ncbi:carboxypeptidase regulatory-like domain-containing protein [Flavobacterium sp. LB3R33]|uniref:carboxypeptidase regulatory-like domain-containing protein n=1 Tax=Flavobacterium sp. LB3R33 TaxID=3401721 RepID=UPI003AB0DCD1